MKELKRCLIIMLLVLYTIMVFVGIGGSRGSIPLAIVLRNGTICFNNYVICCINAII